MAITLPDFTALPDQTPRAVGGVPSLPAEDPEAAGLAQLGKGVAAAGGAVTDIGIYRDLRRTKMDQAMAEADFTARSIPLSEQLKVETDPEKITALKGQFNAALQTASGAIGNPEARQLWLLQNQKHALQGERDIDLRNMVVYHDRWKANAATTVNELVRGAATATDQNAVDVARLRIDQLTEEGAKSGSLSSAEAQALNNKAKIELATGRIDTLTARGQFDAASALLEEHRADLGPVLAAHLEAGIQNKGTAVRTYGAGLRALGMGAASPGEGGGPGAISAADHYNYLTSIGATANEAALLTSAAKNESSFNPTARHDAEQLAKMGLPPGYGLYGHNGQRLTAMQQAAGTGAPSWQDQAKFALGELRGRPEGAQVNAATTPEQLTDLQLRFEQPGPAGIRRADRLAATRDYMTNPPAAAGAAPGAAPGAAAAAPGAAPTAFDLSAGDSIGLSAIKNGGLSGTYADDATKPVFDAARKPVEGRAAGNAQAVGGRSPQGNFDYIDQHPEEFRNKTVFWSTGLMNTGGPEGARNALPIVERQLDRLKELGANVVVVGVDKGKFAPLNSELEALASARQMPFAGALPTTNVHPGAQAMKTYVANAQQLLASGFAGGGDYGGGGDASAAPADTVAPGPGAAAPVVPAAPVGATPGAPPTIQPIPTGQPPAPGTAPAPPPPAANRTGLPMPADVAQRIWADPTLRNDKERAQAFAHAESIYRTSEAALAQQERIRTQAAQQQVRDAENEVYADVYSGTPKITPQQIAVDPRYNSMPERRKSMIELVNNPPGSGIPAPQSYLAAQTMLDRIRLPWGDPNKITTRDQIYDQMRALNRTDLDFVLNKYDQLSAPGESRFVHRLEGFLTAAKGEIDHSGALPGLPRDGRGKTRAYQYERFVEDQIDQYRKANKNPDDLLNEHKPDYLGSDATMKPYKRSLGEALADFQSDYGVPAGTAPGGAPGAPPDPDAAAKAALKAALENKFISPEQAAAEAVRRGWARPPGAPAIAPPVR